MTPAVGDVVRLTGWRGVFRVRSVNRDDTVTIWGGTTMRFGMKTVDVRKLKPARKGDVVPGFPPAFGMPQARRR